MKHSIQRPLLFCCLTIVLAFAFLMLRHPSQSAVVFSNMPSDYDASERISDAQAVVVIFDVPAGSNYQINSLQTPLLVTTNETQVIDAHIRADKDGVPGPVVVDLGSQVVPSERVTAVTFIPLGSATLKNGERYWLVLSSSGAGAEWMGSLSVNAPTGEFSFVDNGIFYDDGVAGLRLHPQRLRYALTIDADPVNGEGVSG